MKAITLDGIPCPRVSIVALVDVTALVLGAVAWRWEISAAYATVYYSVTRALDLVCGSSLAHDLLWSAHRVLARRRGAVLVGPLLRPQRRAARP